MGEIDKKTMEEPLEGVIEGEFHAPTNEPDVKHGGSSSTSIRIGIISEGTPSQTDTKIGGARGDI